MIELFFFYTEWSDFDIHGQILGAQAPPIFRKYLDLYDSKSSNQRIPFDVIDAMGVFVSSWAAVSIISYFIF